VGGRRSASRAANSRAAVGLSNLPHRPNNQTAPHCDPIPASMDPISRCALPNEVLGLIAENSSRSSLLALALVSKRCRTEANRWLYRSILLAVPHKMIALAHIVQNDAVRAALVQTICLDLHPLTPEAILDLSVFTNLRHLHIKAMAHPYKLLASLPDDQLYSFQSAYCWRRFEIHLGKFLGRQRHLTNVSVDLSCKLQSQDLPEVKVLEGPLSFILEVAPYHSNQLDEVTVLGTLDHPASQLLLTALAGSGVKTLRVTLEDGPECFGAALRRIGEALPSLCALILGDVAPADLAALVLTTAYPSFPNLRNLTFCVELPENSKAAAPSLNLISFVDVATLRNLWANSAPRLDDIRVTTESIYWTHDNESLYPTNDRNNGESAT